MTNILQVVDRECRRWDLLSERRRRVEPPLHWPIVTIAREFGARGEAMGRIVAERAGFSFWDGELVHAVAEESGANEQVLRSLDEHRRSGIEESINGALLGGRHMASQYLRGLMRLIKGISAHGASVVVGRGAQYAVEPDAALRVRVVCPLDLRVRGYAERQGLDERAARREVERADSERRRFIKKFFARDPANQSDYDVIVNTGTLPLERAAGLVLDAYDAKFGRRPSPDAFSGIPRV
jgi:hypothetical protein